jgi:ABC-type phosphate/phosphonate transport system substrate-binding protein
MENLFSRTGKPGRNVASGVTNLLTMGEILLFSQSPPFMSKILGTIGALCIILFFFTISAQHALADAASPAVKTLRISYPENLDVDIDRRDARAAMEIWVKTMAKNLKKDYRPEYLEYSDTRQLIWILKEKRADLIGMSGLDFLKVRGCGLLEPELVSPIGGKSTEQFALLTRKDSAIKGLIQLRNRTLLVEAGGRKEAGLLWLDTLLWRNGLPSSSRFFSSIKEVKKTSKAVHPVFFSQADACLVGMRSFDMISELNPQIGSELLVLERSPELLRHILCFRVDYDPAMKKDLRETLPQIHNLPEGRQMLTLLKTDCIVPYDPASIHPLEKLLEEYRRLEKKGYGRTQAK